MDEKILTELVSLIYHQIHSQEELTEYLSKAKALIQVALEKDFLDQKKFVIHDYLWVIFDLIDKAHSFNEARQDELLKNSLIIYFNMIKAPYLKPNRHYPIILSSVASSLYLFKTIN